MRQISINAAKEGMILGRDIYDENNNCLLKNNTVLTAKFIKKLQDIGCNVLCIVDSNGHDITGLECLDYKEKQDKKFNATVQAALDRAAEPLKKFSLKKNLR